MGRIYIHSSFIPKIPDPGIQGNKLIYEELHNYLPSTVSNILQLTTKLNPMRKKQRECPADHTYVHPEAHTHLSCHCGGASWDCHIPLFPSVYHPSLPIQSHGFLVTSLFSPLAPWVMRK